MKAQQKQHINKLPQVTFVERKLDILFPEGYEPFAKKIARAKERLSKAKFPEGFGSR